jgi:hypothetical protein
MQLLTWTRNPSAAASIAARKEELYDEIMSGNAPAEAPGVRAFLETLHNVKVRASGRVRSSGVGRGTCIF